MTSFQSYQQLSAVISSFQRSLNDIFPKLSAVLFSRIVLESNTFKRVQPYKVVFPKSSAGLSSRIVFELNTFKRV